MAEKPVDAVKEEVEEYKVETFDNPIVAYSYEEQHARLVFLLLHVWLLDILICSLCSDPNEYNSGGGAGPMSES